MRASAVPKRATATIAAPSQAPVTTQTAVHPLYAYHSFTNPVFFFFFFIIIIAFSFIAAIFKTPANFARFIGCSSRFYFSNSQSLLDVSGPGSDSSHPSSKRYSMRHNRPVRFPVSLFPRNSTHSNSRTRRLAIRHAKPRDGVMDSVRSLLQVITITPTAKTKTMPAFLPPLLHLPPLLLRLLRTNPHSLTPKNADAKNSSI